MIRWILSLLTAAVVFGATVAVQAQSHTGQPIVLPASPAVLTVDSPNPIATSTIQVNALTTAEPKGPVMRILQRRKMGLTVRKIVQVLKDMKTEGSLNDYRYVAGDGTVEVDVSSLAVAVIDRISVENPEGWIDWENIDWDAIISFVEKFLELILKFLPLFL